MRRNTFSMVEGGTPEILNYLKISLLSVEGRTPEIFYYLKISYQKLFHTYVICRG
jgi:hypothetical protein